MKIATYIALVGVSKQLKLRQKQSVAQDPTTGGTATEYPATAGSYNTLTGYYSAIARTGTYPSALYDTTTRSISGCFPDTCFII